MIINFIRSVVYILIFFLLLRMIGYVLGFIYFVVTKKYKKDKNVINLNQTYALKMLQCEKCKVYIMKSEAYFLNGKVYCKKEHAN